MEKLGAIIICVFFIFPSVAISSEGNIDLRKHKKNYNIEDIEMSIEFISGLEGGELKSGQKGYVLLKIQNKSNEEVAFPIYSAYHHRDVDLKPNYLSKGRLKWNNYKGFEIAKLNYGFKGYKKDYNKTLPTIIVLQPKGYKLLLLSINAPSKPGIYDFEFSFDNRHLITAIRTSSIAPIYDVEKSLFRKDIILQEIEIQ